MPRRRVNGPAGGIQLDEDGDGPVVLLLHGFPESSYAWRHQLPGLVAAGYHAVAIDLRGYGGSDGPHHREGYTMADHVADNLAVLESVGAECAVVVGHDVGATIAADSARLHPDRFVAAAMLSVPHVPPGGPRPSDVFASMGDDEQFYVAYFQSPGVAEAEIEADLRAWLTGFYAALSGEAVPPAAESGVFFIPDGARMADRFPSNRPAWLSERDLGVYVETFRDRGLAGALNRYRNFDADWQQLRDREGEALPVPTLFIGGERDASTAWMPDAVAAHDTVHILDGAGHWIQQERPEQVTQAVLDWLKSIAI